MSAALVIFDTHFGAWAGRDLLREELFLERLADLNPLSGGAGLPSPSPTT